MRTIVEYAVSLALTCLIRFEPRDGQNLERMQNGVVKGYVNH